jgi:hypothetical protein
LHFYHADSNSDVLEPDGGVPWLNDVWAPKGERPLALGHHRYEWLYVYGFVEPATGRTMWNVSNAVCKERSRRWVGRN